MNFLIYAISLPLAIFSFATTNMNRLIRDKRPVSTLLNVGQLLRFVWSFHHGWRGGEAKVKGFRKHNPCTVNFMVPSARGLFKITARCRELIENFHLRTNLIPLPCGKNVQFQFYPLHVDADSGTRNPLTQSALARSFCFVRNS